MSDPKEMKQLQAFGKRMAQLRKSRGLTQQELAEKLDVSLVSIGYIETGKRWPRLSTLHRIAGALGIRVGDIFRDL